jgi:hypothetical protein
MVLCHEVAETASNPREKFTEKHKKQKGQLVSASPYKSGPEKAKPKAELKLKNQKGRGLITVAIEQSKCKPLRPHIFD